MPGPAFLPNKSQTNFNSDALFLRNSAPPLKPKLSARSIHDCNRPHNPVLDQPNKFEGTAVTPAEVLATPVAVAE